MLGYQTNSDLMQDVIGTWFREHRKRWKTADLIVEMERLLARMKTAENPQTNQQDCGLVMMHLMAFAAHRGWSLITEGQEQFYIARKEADVVPVEPRAEEVGKKGK